MVLTNLSRTLKFLKFGRVNHSKCDLEFHLHFHSESEISRLISFSLALTQSALNIQFFPLRTNEFMWSSSGTHDKVIENYGNKEEWGVRPARRCSQEEREDHWWWGCGERELTRSLDQISLGHGAFFSEFSTAFCVPIFYVIFLLWYTWEILILAFLLLVFFMRFRLSALYLLHEIKKFPFLFNALE